MVIYNKMLCIYMSSRLLLLIVVIDCFLMQLSSNNDLFSLLRVILDGANVIRVMIIFLKLKGFILC